MRLKRYYSSRDVTALTGLTADKLRWWERQKLVQPAVASHRTEAGGFTERRYTPVDLLEIMVLADLRRRGFSLTGVVIPTGDAESFIRGAADAGLLRILK